MEPPAAFVIPHAFHCATGALRPRCWAIPAEHSRVVHLVRHAQGHHNLAAAVRGSAAFVDPALFDASLDDVGRAQAEKLGGIIDDLTLEIDVVLVSPLSRTLETCAGLFPNGKRRSGAPLRIAAIEELREAFGAHPCDARRSVSYYAQLHPWVDFSAVRTDADTWATATRETVREVAKRADVVLEVIAALPAHEKRVCIISHGVLLEMLQNRSAMCFPAEVRSRRFENAELRSIIMGSWTPPPQPPPPPAAGAATSATGAASATDAASATGARPSTA